MALSVESNPGHIGGRRVLSPLQPHSGQTQRANATSGFRCRKTLQEFEKNTCRLFVGKCYKSSTLREKYKLGVSEDVH